MKKLTILALALCLAVVMAAPVMAVDADFSGAYRVRGVYTDNTTLLKEAESNAFMNMRFRLQTVFKASDNLSVTTRFDAFDNDNWGTANNGGTVTKGNDIDLDRAYMTIKSGIGKFDLGRMAGGAFGTTFVDSEGDADRIKFTKVMDNLTLLAIYQKNAENDAHQDSATYFLAPIYKMENVTAGVLLGFANDKTDVDATKKTYSANPYFVAKFNELAIQGELSYKSGEIDNEATAVADVDIKSLAYNIEASYNLGSATVLAGYAFASGEDTDADLTAAGGVGNDWEKLFILTTNEVPGLTNLGDYGNVSSAGVAVDTNGDLGAKIIYAGVVVAPAENMSLTFAAGSAKADEVAAGVDDDYGVEYDLTLNWNIYDNLSYTAIAAYLDAGDLWKLGTTAEIENTYALFHQLQLTF